MSIEVEAVKCCPICSKPEGEIEFGKCAARKDGKNLYCKVCIRGKVKSARQDLKEYRAAAEARRAVAGSLPFTDAPLNGAARVQANA